MENAIRTTENSDISDEIKRLYDAYQKAVFRDHDEDIIENGSAILKNEMALDIIDFDELTRISGMVFYASEVKQDIPNIILAAHAYIDFLLMGQYPDYEGLLDITATICNAMQDDNPDEMQGYLNKLADYFEKNIGRTYHGGDYTDVENLSKCLSWLTLLDDNKRSIPILEDAYQNDPRDTSDKKHIRGHLRTLYYKDQNYNAFLRITDDMTLAEREGDKFAIRLACAKTNDDTRLRSHYRSIAGYHLTETLMQTLQCDALPNDEPLTINGMTVDLKQLDDGAIQILEINYLPASGLVGYDRHHKTSMEDKINRDYAELYPRLGISDAYDAQGLLKYNFVGAEASETFRNVCFMSHEKSPLTVNTSLNAMMAQAFKDDFVLNVQALGLASYIPNSVVVSRYNRHDHVMEALSVLESDHFIIKTSNDYRGNGVEIVKANRLNDVTKQILNGGAWHGCQSPRTWEEDYHPNFLVQECVHSKPCRASDGRDYDATMRVALSYVFNHETGKGEILTHGMFWKLPRDPIGQGTARDSLVSLAHNERIKRGRPFAARVAPQRQAQVQEQIESFFETFGPYISRHNTQAIADRRNMMRDDDIVQSALAIEILSSHPYGNIANVMLSDASHPLESVVKEKFHDISHPHLDFLKGCYDNGMKAPDACFRHVRAATSRIFHFPK